MEKNVCREDRPESQSTFSGQSHVELFALYRSPEGHVWKVDFKCLQDYKQNTDTYHV